MSKIIPFHYFSSDFSMDDIKIIYLPQCGHTDMPNIIERHPQYTLSAEKTAYISDQWAQENRKEFATKGQCFQNDRVVSVLNVDSENGNLEVALSDYKTWKTTATSAFFQKFGKKDIPNPLNVQILVETLDKQLIVGLQPENDMLQLPGGLFNVSNFMRSRVQPIVKASVREFNEAIAPIPVCDIKCLGISFDAGRVLSTVYSSGKIDMSVDDLTEYRSQHKDQITDFKNFPSIECIGTQQADIQQALDRAKMHKMTMGALLLYGHQKFGPLWLKKHCPHKMLACHLATRQHTRSV